MKKEKLPSLKLNALSNWCVLAVNVLIGLFLTPFIIKSLGSNNFGVWRAVGSIIGYYGLLDLGIGSALTRYIARYSVQGDTERLNKTASTAMLVFSLAGLIILLLSLFFADKIVNFFNVTSEESKSFIKLLWLMGMITAINLPANIFRAVVIAREHYVASNIINIVRAILRTALAIVFIRIGYGVFGLGLAVFIVSLVAIFANYMLYKKFANDIKLKFSYIDTKVVKTLISYGGFTTIITVANILRTSIDNLVIGKWIDMKSVGVYGIAAIIIKYITQLIVAGNGVLTPRFASLDGLNDHSKLKDLFLKSIFTSSLLALFLLSISLLFIKPFVEIWVGEDFWASSMLFIILIIAWITDLVQNPGIGLMFALNKHRYYSLAVILEGITNLIISILLVTRYGLIGVAIGTVIPMILIRILIQPIYISKIVGIKVSEYLKPFLLPVFSTMITLYVGFKFDHIRDMASKSWTYLIIAGFLMSLLFLLITRMASYFISPGIKVNGILRLVIGNKKYVS